MDPHPPTFPPPPGDALLRRLAAGLAHNVNNALTGVVGCVELALRDCAPGTEAHRRLRDGLACAYRAADAVALVVAFAARTAAAAPPAPLALRAAAEQAAERSWTAGRGVAVRVAGPPGWVRASEGLLRSALDQSLRRALDAAPDGGEVRLRVEEGGGRCRLSVADDGPGLAADELGRLFEPFPPAGGWAGPGLALCREMIEAQGGAVEATSAPGRGTTVVLSFPALEATAADLVVGAA